jgi:hypothetical protein
MAEPSLSEYKPPIHKPLSGELIQDPAWLKWYESISSVIDGWTTSAQFLLEMAVGADIELKSESGNAALIKWTGNSRTYSMGVDYTNDRLCLYPDTDETGDIWLGYGIDASAKYVSQFRLYAEDQIQLNCEDGGGSKYGYVHIDTDDTNSDAYGKFHVINSSGTYETIIEFFGGGPLSDNKPEIQIKALGTAGTAQVQVLSGTSNRVFYWQGDRFEPKTNKLSDLGSSGVAWDEVYGDNFNNVADFFHLDDLDDLASINQIKGSGKICPRYGYELIDDDSLPSCLKHRNKQTGEFSFDPEGKPFIPIKNAISLLMGAIRQLDKKIEDLKSATPGKA